MNNQEAIEVLKDFDKQVSAKADGAYQTDIGKTACDLAVNALEKQTDCAGKGGIREMNDRYIIEQEFEHVGCKCVVTFGNMGHRCGYVGIPKTHPLFGESYGNYLDIKKEDIEGREVSGVIPLMCTYLDGDERVKIDVYFQCHGGITYSGGGEKSKYPIVSDLWWFGFDCAHAGDGKDLKYAFEKFPKYRDSIKCSMECERMFPVNGDIVRSKEYVAGECKRLAEQLREYETIIRR